MYTLFLVWYISLSSSKGMYCRTFLACLTTITKCKRRGQGLSTANTVVIHAQASGLHYNTLSPAGLRFVTIDQILLFSNSCDHERDIVVRGLAVGLSFRHDSDSDGWTQCSATYSVLSPFRPQEVMPSPSRGRGRRPEPRATTHRRPLPRTQSHVPR